MSISIVAIIIILLCALACYAFISQYIEKKRAQKQRVLMALKTKHRNFVYMLNGFPPHFLTGELIGLIYRALIDTCEQLHQIEPNEIRHQDEITLYTNQLAEVSKNNSAQRMRIENPHQMKEIRQHLQELQRFVIQQEAVKTVNKVQFASYIDQIKRLNLQMVVDVYIYQAKQAQQSGKLRLAIHFFGLARKMLSTENAAHNYDKQIIQLDEIISKLDEKAQIQGMPKEETSGADENTTKEWGNYAPADENWKKKQIYD